ncbi:MAG: CAP domain-containing protein, partial [Acidimicrobiia bacterium]|nr:CAP domain-containing protein [Acidimicrobiia bacterium]
MATGRRLLAKGAGLVLGIALLAPVVSTALAAPAHADPGSEEAQFMVLTNQLRLQHGLNALASNGTLVGIARSWSANMAAAGGISHNMNLPNVVTLPWQKLGENVGVGGTVDAIQTAFINSPHHYENLVDPVWNYIGIGVVDSGGRIW